MIGKAGCSAIVPRTPARSATDVQEGEHLVAVFPDFHEAERQGMAVPDAEDRD
jgi:hypothetical protein